MSRRIERAAIVAEELANLYPNPPVPLDHKDAYTLLIAVLLSAQCTDARVNQVTPVLFELADNAEKMQLQSVETVREIIRPCGLSPTKSKNIVALSRQLVEQFHGEVPQDFALLESLPGVGHKTASVVMAQAFGHPAFPVDTHIHRLAQRWGLSSGKSVVQTERDLKACFPRETGMICIYKLYFMAASSARHVAVMAAIAHSVAPISESSATGYLEEALRKFYRIVV